MIYSKQRLRELASIKKAAVTRIQTDITEFDPTARGTYVQEYTEEFRAFDAVCSMEDVFDDARAADLIWIGDYHALSRSQSFANDFLRQLAVDQPNLIVAVEPIFARNQRTLDLWQAGKISESEFLDRIRYQEEWGCDWSSYGPIFETARQLGIPIHGVDCHPRHDMRSIGRRDLGIARRIVRLIERNPLKKVVVIFGESHLAANHLPRRVRLILERKRIVRSELFILQNIDALYWKLQEVGHEDARVVRIKQGQYCVFNATPIEKYESFRQYLQKCVEKDSTGDFGLFIQTLVDVTTGFLRLKEPELFEYLPEVYSRDEAEFGGLEPFRPAADGGTSYIPELNSIFVDSLHLSSAVEESTRFIHHACRGDLHGSPNRSADDQFFVSVIERALGYFCSKLLDSSRDGIEPLADQVLRRIRNDDELAKTIAHVVDPAKRPNMRHFETLRAAVEAQSGGQRVQGMLAHLLGYALGRRLYQAYLESRISRREIHDIFHVSLNSPHRPLECYVELTQRLTAN